MASTFLTQLRPYFEHLLWPCGGIVSPHISRADSLLSPPVPLQVYVAWVGEMFQTLGDDRCFSGLSIHALALRRSIDRVEEDL